MIIISLCRLLTNLTESGGHPDQGRQEGTHRPDFGPHPSPSDKFDQVVVAFFGQDFRASEPPSWSSRSQGQIPVVRDQEVAAIEKVFEQAGTKEVKFAFIIVSKRIKTKFFRDQENPQRHYRGRRGDTERKV